ncbi:hypothetical protein F0562_010711 [Nyssa sinensis]|uniref:Uncharacterized protein n=1 Tax=Nyssa sinensis TaxID=561372 RepID=A0A5J5A2R5_9ASTE|nr:hypothetical protein F0562_010711 [Nyssa sinensis]
MAVAVAAKQQQRCAGAAIVLRYAVMCGVCGSIWRSRFDKGNGRAVQQICLCSGCRNEIGEPGGIWEKQVGLCVLFMLVGLVQNGVDELRQ